MDHAGKNAHAHDSKSNLLMHFSIHYLNVFRNLDLMSNIRGNDASFSRSRSALDKPPAVHQMHRGP